MSNWITVEDSLKGRALAVERERERIIKLIEENTMTITSPLDNSVMRSLRMSPSELIALIKGEQA